MQNSSQLLPCLNDEPVNHKRNTYTQNQTPLTLTLSRREREQLPVSETGSKQAGFANAAFKGRLTWLCFAVPQLRAILPLPWGEGRGEGNLGLSCGAALVGFLPLVLCLCFVTMFVGCSSAPTAHDNLGRQLFGHTPDGTPVYLFTLRNAQGAEARIINYGGLLLSLKVPDRNGKMGDVVLGYDNLADYIKETPYFGALIGRYGNRIAKGQFTLDGRQYTLATNNYPNSLHGGVKGFDKVVWQPSALTSPEGPGLKLTYLSHDGEEGYPANLSVTAVYTLTEDNALKLEFTATTDRNTVLNLTHHSYFNLAGQGDILHHVVMMPADKFTPVDSTLIPTGELKPVDGTPFDFRKPTAIGLRIGQDDEQLKFGKGYDHNWVINKRLGEMTLMARVAEPTTGRIMEVFSTEPGLQFYSGNFLDGTLKGKGGWVYQFRNGFCMEPQHYPDSPNKPDWPSVVLHPGETYHNTIVYKFSVQK